MSRVKSLKRARHHNGFKSIPGQLSQRPPLQQQIDMLKAGIDRLAYHLSELELMIHFTMRQFKLQRPIPGSIITSTDGKPQYETMTIFEKFQRERVVFAQQLMEEHRALACAQADAAASAGEVNSGEPDPHAAADQPTGPTLVADKAGN